jgi:hypothetical protein
VLYSFCSQPDCTDGNTPIGELLTDGSGALYGVASSVINNGRGGCGTVFKLMPPSSGETQWSFLTIYSFSGGSDGCYPYSGLIRDASGTLYVTSLADGAGNLGGR